MSKISTARLLHMSYGNFLIVRSLSTGGYGYFLPECQSVV